MIAYLILLALGATNLFAMQNNRDNEPSSLKNNNVTAEYLASVANNMQNWVSDNKEAITTQALNFKEVASKNAKGLAAWTVGWFSKTPEFCFSIPKENPERLKNVFLNYGPHLSQKWISDSSSNNRSFSYNETSIKNFIQRSNLFDLQKKGQESLQVQKDALSNSIYDLGLKIDILNDKHKAIINSSPNDALMWNLALKNESKQLSQIKEKIVKVNEEIKTLMDESAIIIDKNREEQSDILKEMGYENANDDLMVHIKNTESAKMHAPYYWFCRSEILNKTGKQHEIIQDSITKQRELLERLSINEQAIKKEIDHSERKFEASEQEKSDFLASNRDTLNEFEQEIKKKTKQQEQERNHLNEINLKLDTIVRNKLEEPIEPLLFYDNNRQCFNSASKALYLFFTQNECFLQMDKEGVLDETTTAVTQGYRVFIKNNNVASTIKELMRLYNLNQGLDFRHDIMQEFMSVIVEIYKQLPCKACVKFAINRNLSDLDISKKTLDLLGEISTIAGHDEHAESKKSKINDALINFCCNVFDLKKEVFI